MPVIKMFNNKYVIKNKIDIPIRRLCIVSRYSNSLILLEWGSSNIYYIGIQSEDYQNFVKGMDTDLFVFYNDTTSNIPIPKEFLELSKQFKTVEAFLYETLPNYTEEFDKIKQCNPGRDFVELYLRIIGPKYIDFTDEINSFDPKNNKFLRVILIMEYTNELKKNRNEKQIENCSNKYLYSSAKYKKHNNNYKNDLENRNDKGFKVNYSKRNEERIPNNESYINNKNNRNGRNNRISRENMCECEEINVTLTDGNVIKVENKCEELSVVLPDGNTIKLEDKDTNDIKRSPSFKRRNIFKKEYNNGNRNRENENDNNEDSEEIKNNQPECTEFNVTLPTGKVINVTDGENVTLDERAIKILEESKAKAGDGENGTVLSIFN